MDTPLLDKRSFEDIVKEIKDMSPNFTDEWSFDMENPDAGTALMMVFAMQMKETADLLNRSLDKNLVSYLNMSGIGINAPKPSCVPVVFTLTTDERSVVVEKGTRLSVSGDDSLFFETGSFMEAVPVRVNRFFYGSDRRDFVVDANDGSFELFGYDMSPNIQLHELYFMHDGLLNAAGPVKIMLKFDYDKTTHRELKLLSLLADEDIVSWQYYSAAGWAEFDEVSFTRNILVLTIMEESDFAVNESLGARALRVRLKNRGLKAVEDLYIETVGMQVKAVSSTGEDAALTTDRLFYNDNKLNIDDITPFGSSYNISDSFYIGCDEAFTKSGASIKIEMDIGFSDYRDLREEKKIRWRPIMKKSEFEEDEPPITTISDVSWSYYNGVRWEPLRCAGNAQSMFCCRLSTDDMKELIADIAKDSRFETPNMSCRVRKRWKGSIAFICPDDMALISVGGEIGCFIRGEIKRIDNYYAYRNVVMVPKIENLKLSFDYGALWMRPERVTIVNNNEMYDIILYHKRVKPFVGIGSDDDALYMCLSKPPTGGPINVLAVIEPSDAEPVHLRAEYLRHSGSETYWEDMKVIDGTEGLSMTGIITFGGLANFAVESMFGCEGCWIRLIWPEGQAALRKIDSVWFNGVWASQRCSVENEHPTAGENGAYSLFFAPVMEESLWVDELRELSRREMGEIKSSNMEYIEVVDELGIVIEFWVKWSSVELLTSMKSNDRVYYIDRMNGEITFGDGVCGKKPPNSADKIKVSYTYGGGAKGNVKAGAVDMLYSNKAFIDRVFNPVAAIGGTDCETVEEAVLRGTRRIKNKGAGISARDIENIIKSEYPDVADVRCIANADQSFNESPGCINVVVMQADEGELRLSPVVKKDMERTLKAKVPEIIGADSIFVTGVRLVRISLSVTLISDREDIYAVKADAEERLKSFFDRQRGGLDGTGWKIGNIPNKNKIYAALSGISGVSKIERLSVIYEDAGGLRPVEMQWESAVKIKNAVVTIGGLNIRVMREAINHASS